MPGSCHYAHFVVFQKLALPACAWPCVARICQPANLQSNLCFRKPCDRPHKYFGSMSGCSGFNLLEKPTSNHQQSCTDCICIIAPRACSQAESHGLSALSGPLPCTDSSDRPAYSDDKCKAILPVPVKHMSSLHHIIRIHKWPAIP